MSSKHAIVSESSVLRWSCGVAKPSQVDMATIATIQAAFARNFPFQKHGEKFADLDVRSSLKNLITSEGPGRLIG